MSSSRRFHRRIRRSETAADGRDGIASAPTPDVDVEALEASLKSLRAALDAEAKTFALLRKPGVTPEALQAFFNASLELRRIYAESLKLQMRAPVILADASTPRHERGCSESSRTKSTARRHDDDQG